MASVYYFPPTGDAYVDGLLMGTGWAQPLTFSFPADGSFYGPGYPNGEPYNEFSRFTPSLQTAVRHVLENVSAVTNLSFTELTESSTVHADLRYARSVEVNNSNNEAWAYYPDTAEWAGDSWYWSAFGSVTALKGTNFYDTILHETGHALGLKHPHDYVGSFARMPSDRDGSEYSVMSYNRFVPGSSGGPGIPRQIVDGGFPETFMMYDVAALQVLYGANYATNNGNTTYQWSPSTGEMFIDGVGDGEQYGNNTVFLTVWDGGGLDTYDFSNYSTRVNVNLQPGGWTICSPVQLAFLGYDSSNAEHWAVGNIANALLYENNPVSLIENAISGPGNDTMVGNIAANTLTGGGGNDTLTGAAGADTAIYSGAYADYNLVRNTDGSWSIADLRSGSPDGSDTLWTMEFCEFDDRTYTLASPPPANRPPTVAIADQRVGMGQWSQIDGWISYSDADGNAATQYQFWDQGIAANSGYFSTPGNSHHPPQTVITVNAEDLANVSVRGGQVAGSETLWVRAFDGTDWSAWDPFNFITVGGNRPPVATVGDHSLGINASAQIQGWISYSDADGNAATQYQFWDQGLAANSGYFSTPSNSHHAAETLITVNAADLANVLVHGGQAVGTETLWVRAFDGTDWSQWDSFNFTTLGNSPPVATIGDHSLGINGSAQVQAWISYSDANGNAATQYQFWDQGIAASSGYFSTPGNAHHPSETLITVNAVDLANVLVRGGQVSGSETLWVRAFDGTDWSAWDSFNFTTVGNSPPVATVGDHSLAANQWAQVQGWISYSDADGNAATQYQFWDQGIATNSAYFRTPSNAHHPSETVITVNAADLANVLVHGGQVAGSESLWVRAFDGTAWSAWDSWTMSTFA